MRRSPSSDRSPSQLRNELRIETPAPHGITALDGEIPAPNHFRPLDKPAKRPRRVRIDVLLVDIGLATSRAKAQALVLAGDVQLGEQRVDKPGTLVPSDALPSVKQAPKFVSRGGFKIEGALETLGLEVSGKVCIDVGASTGGFTDCLLQRGAAKVYAIDVGSGLLANKLVQDHRVVVMDKTNARHLEPAMFAETPELIVVDASFIGIGKFIDALASVLPAGGQLLAMIKPQFEVGRAAAQKARGVITDPETRAAALDAAQQQIAAAGFSIRGGCDSVLHGPKGNIEYFVHATRNLPAECLTG